MKLKKVLLLFLVASPISLLAQTEISVGLKAWKADSKQGDGSFYGPILSIDVDPDLWLSAMLTTGEFKYDEWGNKSEMDGELLVGKSFSMVDVGVGVRYISSTYEVDRYNQIYGDKVNGYGPMIYAGTGLPFGESPIGWYAGGSLTPILFGDFEKEKPYYTLEGGLFGSWEKWGATLGYRGRGSSQTDLQKGFVVSASYKF